MEKTDVSSFPVVTEERVWKQESTRHLMSREEEISFKEQGAKDTERKLEQHHNPAGAWKEA